VSTVFLLSPALTLGNSADAEKFFQACKKQLAAYVPVSEILNETALRATRPGNSDAVIVFNESDNHYRPSILQFLADCRLYRAVIISIAMTPNSRRPPEPIQNEQSFDVTEQLRLRSLSSAHLETIATVFSRQLLAKLEPTLTNEPMHIFLSYRRIDGEEIAGWFDADLRARAQTAFRDLLSVKIGEDAQEVIERSLSECDAVVFIDTPKAGDSVWIEKELQTALSFNLPIVWVRVGPEENRINLPVMPAQRPHFSFSGLQASNERIPAETIDQIVHKAFEICREIFASRVFDQIGYIRRLSAAHGATFHEMDKSRLLYTITFPRKEFRYPLRPITQVLQFFGRWPTENDRGQMDPYLRRYGYEPHPKHGPYYDTAILLAPVPTRPDSASLGSPYMCVESSDDYVQFIEGHLVPKRLPHSRKGVIISGAFPDCEPEHQQYLTDAVHAFTRGCLDRSGTIIFGAHPTFQHLIFDMAKRRRPEDFKSVLHMYISRFFATDAALEEYAKYASVFPTEAVVGSRGESLTAMRRAMINDSQAVALIAIGGKTSAGGHAPGVDEEVALAHDAGIPVFIVGSVGGRSGQLGLEWNSNETTRGALNALSVGQNEQLLNSIDYLSLTSLVLDSLEM
jgi:hypothetical protein